MRRVQRFLAFATLCVLALGLISLSACKNKKSPFAQLPDIYSGQFATTPYIEAAIQLQTLGESAAVSRLKSLAAGKENEDTVIVLCRMLFTNRMDGEFRRPLIGGATFMGDTDYQDWPLEPIEIVDGIPFLVTLDYIVGGYPEPSETYLEYCLTNCQWNPFQYRVPTADEKKAALAKLLASPKWQRPLAASEQEFLSRQVQ